MKTLLARIAAKAKAFASHVGRRGFALFFFASVFLISGYSNIAAPQPLTYVQEQAQYYLLQTLPRPAWGVLFLVSGLVALVGVIYKPLEKLAFSFLTALTTVYGLGYLLGASRISPAALQASIYASGALWLAMATLLLLISGWKENKER